MKRLFTTLAAVLAVGLLAGAANAGQKVKIGTEGAYPPFNSIDKDGNLVGFDVDIISSFAAESGMAVAFKPTDTFHGIWTRPGAGEADLAGDRVAGARHRLY